MVAAVESSAAPPRSRTGSRRKRLVSRWISGGMVAEKNSVCRRWRQQPADPLDVGNEPHVEHAVGLVDDEDLDAGQQDAAALELVEHAAGRRDQHIDAAVELGGSDRRTTRRRSAGRPRACGSCRIFRSSRAPAPRVRGSARGSACAACGPRARPFSSSVSMGSTNEAVLPVPVWAMPMMSFFSRTCGIAWAWMSVGVV